MRYFLERGAIANDENMFGSTVLLHAAQRGHGATVAALLSAGAAVDRANVDRYMYTPLMVRNPSVSISMRNSSVFRQQWSK